MKITLCLIKIIVKKQDWKMNPIALKSEYNIGKNNSMFGTQ